MIQNEAYWNNLIINHLTGNSTNEEDNELFSWIAASGLHKNYFNEIEKLWFVAEQKESKKNYNAERAYAGFEKMTAFSGSVKKVRKMVWIRFAPYAAMLVLGLLLGYYGVKNAVEPVQRDSKTVLTTPKGTRSELLLPDGTKVFLNAASQLEFASAFGGRERKVTLRGEGYFEVAKDVHRPFIVETGELDIVVLGTKFNLSNYANNDNIELALLEGQVEISKREDQNKIRVKPQERVRYSKESDEFRLESANSEAAIAWVHGKLHFNSVRFGDIVKILERSFNVKIIVHGSRLNDRVFFGEFEQGETIEQIMNVITADGNHRYERKGNNIYIYEKET